MLELRNRPSMLINQCMIQGQVEKLLFIKGKKHGRMMLDSIHNRPLVYPTIEEDRHTRLKKYSELTDAQQLQDDYDVPETNIILYGLSPDVYALVNHQEVKHRMIITRDSPTKSMTSKLLYDNAEVQVIPSFMNAASSRMSKFVMIYLNPLALEIDALKETLSNNVKEKESLSKTLTVFKIESKENESKYIDKEVVLEKQNKEVENIICKMYRSTQAMHMLTKPHFFYNDTHKQALGYQNPFYLKKAQRIKPTLYDGSVIAKEHIVISVIDDEETLILEEESRLKILDKQNDPLSIEKKINISQINYSKLNKIKEDFGKRFVSQKELSAEQAFWLKHSNHSFDTSDKSHTPVRIKAPSELPKTCLNLRKPSEKLVAVTPINKDKRVRFTEPVTSSSNIPKQTDPLKTKDSNKPFVTSTGVNTTTSASGSKPSGNIKKNRITRPPSSNKKNKVDVHPKTDKSSLNKTNSISEPISNAHVKHSIRNAKFESICAICNKCLFDANHDMCLIDYVNDVNVRSKSKS
ncbi:hypothetical protein Tco_1294668 [Tanacetum coccineum]